LPARSSVPLTITSTSASAAIRRGSGSAAKSARLHAGRDQRAQAAQGTGERVGQAERQELGLRIGPQHPERQHHERRELARPDRRHAGHGHQEPVAAARQRLDESRCIGGVAQRLAELANTEVESLLEVDQRAVGPHVVPDLAAGEHLPAATDEELEHLERLGGEPDEVPVAPQLP
jgi:hypothetical protein